MVSYKTSFGVLSTVAVHVD